MRVGEAFPTSQASSSSFVPEFSRKFGSACPNPFVSVEFVPGSQIYIQIQGTYSEAQSPSRP